MVITDEQIRMAWEEVSRKMQEIKQQEKETDETLSILYGLSLLPEGERFERLLATQQE